MSVTIAQMPVTAFCYGSAEQLECLARLNIKTMEDMWRYIAASTPPVEDANVPLVIHKRHVIGLCTHRCNKLFFDFDKLYRERGVVVCLPFASALRSVPARGAVVPMVFVWKARRGSVRHV